MAETRNGLLTEEFISHPGDTLLELLEQYGVSQKELAVKTETSEKHINEIIKGKKNISVSFAKKLENVLPPDVSFWINRQAIYDEKMETLKIKNNITKEEKDMIKKFPMKELEQYGYISTNDNDVDKVLKLRKFCSISDLRLVEAALNVMSFSVAFKMDNTSKEVDPYRLYSWLRMCQIETESIHNPNYYDIAKLKESLEEIKKCSLLSDSKEAYLKVVDILYGCGINFKIVRNLKSTPVQGYIKTLNDKISLCVTLKWHYEDVFWFTLFHEIGHLLQRRNNKIFIDFDDEENANEFAKNYLISKSSYDALVKGEINEERILKCAKDNNISPSIVIGRMKKEGIINYDDTRFNHLQKKIEWQEVCY